MSELRRKLISGVGWRGLVDAAQIVLQIALTAILARLLGLADFGLAAMCLVFLRFVRALTDVGWFGAAIIQSQEITERQISALFVIHVSIKLGVCGLCVATAPLAAAFFAQPALVDLVRVLAFSILIDSLAFPQTLARKQLRFRGYSLLELGAMVTGGTLGIAMAFDGFGVWSLIARHVAQAAVFSAAIWPIVGWRPVRPDFRGVGRYMKFGLTLFGSSAAYFFSQHFAAVVIGKFIGVETLGLYNVAYNLGIVPAQKIESALATVLTPAFAKLQKSADSLRRSVYGSVFSISALFFPLMLGLAAIAPNFVPVVYGEKWAPAGEFLVVLALVGLAKGLELLLRPVLVATGRPKSVLLVAGLEAIVGLPCLWAGSALFGVWGVVAAYPLGSLLALLATAYYAQRAIDGPGLVLAATWRSLLAAGLMFAIVFTIPMAVTLSRGEALAIQLAVGAIVYAIVRWTMLSRVERQILRTWPLLRKL